MTESSPTRYVIAGGGTAGWMSAAALARFAPPGTSITLVESDAIGTVGVGEATIPQIHLFNRALGLDEGDFLRATKGSFKLGIEFDGWLREGEAYMHAFGSVGRGHGLMPFHQYWLRAQALGIAKPTAAYALNEQAARAIRMHRGPTQNGPPMPYAFHFDAGLYADFLRAFAEGRGVRRVEGKIANVAQHGESGDIAALELDGGERIEGDFFIDCTGFRGLLIEGALAAGFDDWSEYLPCDRAVAVPCENGGEFTPYTRATARAAGWQWRIPLQHRIGNGLVYCSRFMEDDAASEMLLANLDGKPLGDPRPIRFTTGTRRAHWKGNCLAVGLSAGFMEPMESTSIHLIQSAISRFLSVLPNGRGGAATRDWFNAQSRFEWERIRDFLVLHYTANAREGQPFWDHMRAIELPDTLQAKIEAWRANGHIHREHEELFTEVAWFQVFAGQGVEAQGRNPIADALPEPQLRQLLEQTETAIAAEVRPMAHHIDVIKSTIGTRTPQELPA
ncbi:tryptophan halogenase family protein [Aurantiacibacter aquimixticola]|uniref:Tryptophan 7-halogenase n=1 Tax=Aurantiacibacter aquimixticola TaxID=1958945 RepID=A0A419RQQ2_9SPHN|nr:tryptophan halogenase family protein [Aurantiacibacter aquimixticola]RJY08123.1 tryptophan 7-halogenase [Aurantiacibacter aquimixticola]